MNTWRYVLRKRTLFQYNLLFVQLLFTKRSWYYNNIIIFLVHVYVIFNARTGKSIRLLRDKKLRELFQLLLSALFVFGSDTRRARVHRRYTRIHVIDYAILTRTKHLRGQYEIVCVRKMHAFILNDRTKKKRRISISLFRSRGSTQTSKVKQNT